MVDGDLKLPRAFDAIDMQTRRDALLVWRQGAKLDAVRIIRSPQNLGIREAVHVLEMLDRPTGPLET